MQNLINLNSEWVLWTTGVLLLLLLAGCVFLAWWAMFSDRARGRRRCPRCWYDLAYTPGMTCNECGYTGRSEKDFARTRHRWGIALLAVLGAALVGGYIIDRANMKGWMTYVPQTALIWLMPLEGDRGPIISELRTRMNADTLSEDQWLTILRRAAKGDPGRRPPGDGWTDKYGTLLQACASRFLDGDDEEVQAEVTEILLRLPPRVALTTRRSWPSDIAPTLNVVARDWWPGQMQWRIRAEPQLEGAETDVHVLRDAPIQRRSYSVYLPQLPEGDHDIPVRLVVDRRPTPEDEWERIDERTIEVPLEVEGTLAEHMEAVGGEEMDEVIRRVFGSGLIKSARGSLPVRVGLNIRHAAIAPFDDTAVGVRIDVLRDGELGRQLDIWWEAGTFGRGTSWEVPWLDDEVLGRPMQEGEQWTLRVRGRPELALRVDGATRYWSGEVTVGVPVRRRGGAPPPPGG
ncbi:MAG: hypothetical protein SYC29_08145, partial [Planctomycetota bacterium]|nr:hypothetical protein [Planctomycetota bacterium]